MKKILSFTFILLFSIVIFAQKTISGTVKNDDGKPLASASVTIEEIGKNAILEYAITDAKGNYKVTFTSNDEKILVKVKAFNHQTITGNYNNATQTLNFVLQEKATEIKEVKLKTKLITKRGDTISYDLKSFESKADRSLADVLKKIPGIEVNKDGSILYQGEPINKFYVNGKDLMEGSYGLINNSLPKDAVQKVEVLENHQPVKILQDKLSSENAAINVQLKKSITMTGRGETSLGVAPSLWNVKLSPMLFTQKYQWVLNYKTNNMGEEVEKENNILAFGNRFEGMRRNFSENSWLSVENAATPQNVPVKRYLLNNVHYLSANVLTNLSKQWELKANASYSNNAIERESMVKTFNANNDLTNTSLVSNNFYTNQAKGEIIFSKNANKSFFKNTTTYNGLWNGDLANTKNLKPGNYKYVHYDSPDERGIDVALLYNEKVFKVKSSKAIHVTIPGETIDYTRDILMVNGEVAIQGKKEQLFVFVNHWPSRSEGEEQSAPKRAAAAETLKRAVDSLNAKFDDPNIIIMGDFNDTPVDISIQRILLAKGVSDSYADESLVDLMTNMQAMGLGSYNYKGNWQALDQFIVSESLLDGSGLQVNPASAIFVKKDWMLYHNDKYGDSPDRTFAGIKYIGGYSDHLPVFVGFVVK